MEISSRLSNGYPTALYYIHLLSNSADLLRNTHGPVNNMCQNVMNSATTAVSETLIVLGLVGVLLFGARTHPPGRRLPGSSG